MRIPAAILLTLLASLTCSVAPAAPDLVAVINEIRARGCSGNSGARTALSPDPQLDRAARAMASGRSVKDAMTGAGYRAVQSTAFEVSGSDTAISHALAKRGCKDIVDPVYRDIGVAQSGGKAWIVLAVPFIPPPARDMQAVSRRVLELVNKSRTSPRRCGRKRFDAAAPLALSQPLQNIALAHARDMAESGRLSHEGSDGSTPGERVTRGGYAWRVVGENIAAGQPTPEQVVAEWVRSPHHCSNLMDGDFSEMGVAYAVEPRSSAGIYWAQVFATPRQ